MTSRRKFESKRIRFQDQESEDELPPPPPPEDDELPPPPPPDEEEEKEITPSPVFSGKTTQDCFEIIAQDVDRLLIFFEALRKLWGRTNIDDLKKMKQDVSAYPKDSVDFKNALSITRTILWNNLNQELSFLLRFTTAKLEEEWDYLVDLYEALGKKLKFSPNYTRAKQETRKKFPKTNPQQLYEYNATLAREIRNIRPIVAAHVKKLLS